MADHQPEKPKQNEPPFSSFTDPADPLLRYQSIQPPRRPGVLGVMDHLELVSLVGQGGMGLVYKARIAESDRIVAVKMLRPELVEREQVKHRFVKEAQHMARLKHPHILELLEVGGDDKLPYFVMPFMERGSLARVLSPDKLIPADQCLSIAKQVASALQHAHTKGIIHRDLKPDNILFDSAGKAYLTDFGLARTVFNDSWIDAGQVHREGTAPYMSPQLAEGRADDTRCDIYAFGALLYEMLTGRPPYEGPSPAVILERIRHGPPPAILKLRPDAPPGLTRIAEWAMSRELRHRYAEMGDVLADLERIEQSNLPLGPRGKALQVAGLINTYRKTAYAAFAAFVYVVAVGGLWLAGRPRLEVVRRIGLPAGTKPVNFEVGHWNGDGKPDILIAYTNVLQLVSDDGLSPPPITLERPRTTALHLSLVEDITGDGLDEAFVSWANGTNAYLAAMNRQGWLVKEFSFSGNVGTHQYWGTNYSTLRAVRVADLDNDGGKEVLFAVQSAWALRPRGFGCFDLETGKLEWFEETATYVEGVELADLDGDGTKEVVVGCNSPSNGVSLPDGTDDAHAYVYVYSHRNKQLLWRRELAGYFAKVEPIAAVPAAGRATDLVAWVSTYGELRRAKDDPEIFQVLKFDANTNVVSSYSPGAQIRSGLAADLDDNGRQEIILSDRGGTLHLLDADLRLVAKTSLITNRFSHVDLQLVAVAPLSGGRSKYILLISSQVENRTPEWTGNTRATVSNVSWHQNVVLVLDSKLRLVARHLVHEQWSEPQNFSVKMLNTPGQQPEILVLAHEAQFLRMNKSNSVPY